MSGARHDACRAGWRVWLVAAAMLPAVALAQGADELASMIQQSLDGIEYRVDLRPKLAAQDLSEQQRRLELLEQQAPEHPELPVLRAKLATLQEQVASSLTQAAGDAATGEGAAQVPSAPEAFDDGLEQVGTLQKQAESAFLIGENAEAADYLAQAERQMAALEQRYGDEIPKGHATLIVTKEKLAALKDQLAQAD
jgi:hypothetical protein